MFLNQSITEDVSFHWLTLVLVRTAVLILSKIITPIVKWSIVEKIYSDARINYCKLCLLEKLYIPDFIDDNRLLNKRSEFISGCKHHYKLLLKNVK